MKKIKMHLFGKFSLEYGERYLDEETLHSNKLTKLLVYILINRETVLPHQSLLEVLENDDSQNPENVLKNLMYRMRKVLAVLGDEKFICTSTGAYKWNPNILVETDYEKFEENVKELHKETQKEKKKELCNAILEGYKTNVSKKVALETWMLPKAVWYQTSYMEAVDVLCGILEEEKEWQEIELICNRAMEVDTFDEHIHCWLLKSMHGQRKYDQVFAQYEKSKKIFYESMGVQIPESVQKVFKTMLKDIGNETKDITKLLEEMRETEKLNGAFVCDYHVFRQIYRIEVRRSERIGIAEHMLCFTIRKKNNQNNQTMFLDNAEAEGMEALELTLRCCLRAGDVIARYSPVQFAVLLPMCSYESGIMVAGRIQDYFKKMIGKKGIELTWELQEIQGEV